MKSTEEKIRPKNLIKQAKIYFDQDVNYLRKNKNTFVEVDCPACKSNKKKFYFKKKIFKYFICIRCETVYVTPRPSEKLLFNFYKNSKLYSFWNKFIFPASERERKKIIFKPRAKKIIKILKKNLIKNNALIDIGAGHGTFCEVMKNTGFFKKVIAIEPNYDGYLKCKEKKIETYNCPIENLKKTTLKNINVATSFEVIEHVFNPKKFIQKIVKKLTTQSVIILTCPNVKGFDVQTLHKKSDTYDHEHLNYFNPYSINVLLKKCNLKTIEIITPGELDLDIIFNKFKEKKILFKNFFFINLMKDKKLRYNFQNFIKKNNLSSHMWVIAKKIR